MLNEEAHELPVVALQPVEEMAWTLRLSKDRLLEVVPAWQKPGWCTRLRPGWLETNFAKRPPAVPVREHARSDRVPHGFAADRNETLQICNAAAAAASSSTSASVYDSDSFSVSDSGSDSFSVSVSESVSESDFEGFVKVAAKFCRGAAAPGSSRRSLQFFFSNLRDAREQDLRAQTELGGRGRNNRWVEFIRTGSARYRR